MSKVEFFKLESHSDYANFASLIAYSVLLAISPRAVLMLGGMVLWLLLFVRWMRGSLC